MRAAGEHYLTLTIHFYFPTLLRRDLDGGLKIAQDALCEAMGLNDNRIMEIHLYKALDRDNPRLECTLALASLSGPGIHKTRRRSTRSLPKPLRKTHLGAGALNLIEMGSRPCFSYVLLGMQRSTP